MSRLDGMIKEYDNNRELYKNFSKMIVNILEELLNKNNIQYQMVSSRVKEKESLRTKLLENKSLSNLTSISELDDLAGCRVIFYFDSEINKFMNLVYKRFTVVKNNLHYTEDDYNARHLVIKIKKEPINLTKYAPFKDLQCELQLTTVLFYAWSEISHNITYKTAKDIVEFDSKKYELLKDELKVIMKNYIKPANLRFEFINQEYINLLEGKEIFSTYFLRDIVQSNDRREMHSKLLLLGHYVKKYGDKTPSEFKLPDLVKKVINRSLNFEMMPQLCFGYKHQYIVTQCIDILCVIRYQYPRQVFAILAELALDKNKVIRDKAIDVIRQMSVYNFELLIKNGLSMQFFILDQIKNWNLDEQLRRINVIKMIFKEIFKLEYKSTKTIDYNNFSIGFGIVSDVIKIKQIREHSIELLKKLYEHTENIRDKLIILDVMIEATKTPIQTNYTEKVENMVKKNTTSIIKWYLIIIEKGAAFEVIKEIDKQLNWFVRRFKYVNGLSTLHKKINSNDRYIIYKDLIGYDYDYLQKLDCRKAREVRMGKIKQYIDKISNENENYWTTIIIDICVNFNIHNYGEYTYFNQFLYDLACKRPEFARNLILKHEDDTKVFLHHIIAGLKTNKYDFAHQKIEEWIESGTHLINCVDFFLYFDTVNIEILERIFIKASTNEETRVLHELFRILNTSKVDKMLSKSLYIKVIYQLSNLNDYSWTTYVWLKEDSILNKFSENEYEQILDILKKCPQIEYNVEQMLIPIANVAPKKVIKFFESRLEIQENEKKINIQYTAIPFHLNELGEALKNNSKVCIPLIFKWFNKDYIYRYEASDLLQKLFPLFDKPLEVFFLGILKNKNTREGKVILEVLSRYEGNSLIYNFSQQFVIAFQDEPELLQKLMYVLSKTGVVAGEYGFVEELKQTKKEIRKWNKCKNEAVRRFVKDFVDYLNSNISNEKKRTDERVQLMKHEFEVAPKLL